MWDVLRFLAQRGLRVVYRFLEKTIKLLDEMQCTSLTG